MPPAVPARRSSSTKVSNHLVALSAAAIVAVYAAGFEKTRLAAERFDEQARRRAEPPPATAPRRTAAIATTPRRLDPPVAAPTAPARIPSSLAATRPPTAQSSPATPQISEPALVETPTASSVVASATPVVEPAVTPPAATSSLGPDPRPAPDAPDARPAPAAPNAPAAPPESATASSSEYQDGIYLGWGSCRHGDIQARVIIEHGLIISASVAQCLTRYNCNWIEALPYEIIERQLPHVDAVSGATESSWAYEDAVKDALAKAK